MWLWSQFDPLEMARRLTVHERYRTRTRWDHKMEVGMDIPWDLQNYKWGSMGVIRGVSGYPQYLNSLFLSLVVYVQ